jgi:hypothetical protein
MIRVDRWRHKHCKDLNTDGGQKVNSQQGPKRGKQPDAMKTSFFLHIMLFFAIAVPIVGKWSKVSVATLLQDLRWASPPS